MRPRVSRTLAVSVMALLVLGAREAFSSPESAQPADSAGMTASPGDTPKNGTTDGEGKTKKGEKAGAAAGQAKAPKSGQSENAGGFEFFPEAILAEDPLDGGVLSYAPEPTRVHLSVWFDSPAEYRFRWGTERDRLDRVTETRYAPGNGPMRDSLEPLEGGLRYYYRLEWLRDGILRTGSTESVVTQRDEGTPFRFVVEADPHFDEAVGRDAYESQLSYMKSLAPDFVIDLGDTSMIEKLATGLGDAELRYRMIRALWDRIGGSSPFFMVLGNHDGEAGWRIRQGAVRPAEAAALRRTYVPNPIPSRGGAYSGVSDTAYAFAWGDALFIVLDPFANTASKGGADNWSWTLGREQYDWLKQTLAESNSRYRFVFIHNLVGGMGKDNRGGSAYADRWEWGGYPDDPSQGSFAESRAGWEMPIHDLLVKGKVSAVFHGHDHFFAREEKDGVVYQLVPQPGTKIRQNAAALAGEYGYSNARTAPSPGFLLVSVSPAQATVDLMGVGVDGSAVSYTILPVR